MFIGFSWCSCVSQRFNAGLGIVASRRTFFHGTYTFKQMTSEQRYQQMVDTTTSCAGHPEWCNGDQSGSGREPDYVINVHCNGSMGAVGLESVSCAVPAQAIDGSAPYFEVYPPMAQGLIQGNAKLWRDSTGAVERLAIGTVAAAAGPIV